MTARTGMTNNINIGSPLISKTNPANKNPEPILKTGNNLFLR
jgi:hypothetical protein